LEITRNFKNQSKFEDIQFAKAQELPSDALVSNNATVHCSPSSQQAQLRITNLPHYRGGGTGMNNYAMAVKRTLDQKKENTNNIVPPIPPTSSATPLTLPHIGTFNRGNNMEQTLFSPRSKWFDRNIRNTVNAKEIDGGPKINGRLE
jgi:hypothetical protein